MAEKRAQEGYTYQQERGFDVVAKITENEAVGEFTNMGIGFGTMAGVGGAVGGMLGGATVAIPGVNIVVAPLMVAAATTTATVLTPTIHRWVISVRCASTATESRS